MGRVAIETLLHMMDVAYRADPFSGAAQEPRRHHVG
jgi:hypothetical protein